VDILIRELPGDVHAELVRRAGARGMSLRAYVVEVLRAHASSPTLADWLEGVRALDPVKAKTSGAKLVKEGRAGDDALTGR
jgi:plasmid stability protein